MMETNNTQNKVLFESLFSEYVDVVYRLCLYKISDQAVAEDLTQETFTRLWKMMCNGSRIDKPKSYIFQIARNLIIDHYKSQKTLSLDALQEDGFDPKDKSIGPEVESDISLLKDSIESLETDYREAVYLRYVEGYKVKEIAEILDVSENLAAVRLNRGMNKLREKFTKS